MTYLALALFAALLALAVGSLWQLRRIRQVQAAARARETRISSFVPSTQRFAPR